MLVKSLSEILEYFKTLSWYYPRMFENTEGDGSPNPTVQSDIDDWHREWVTTSRRSEWWLEGLKKNY
jgi:hypothetical protein